MTKKSAVKLLRKVEGLNRMVCRIRVFEERFSADRMACEYLAVDSYLCEPEKTSRMISRMETRLDEVIRIKEEFYVLATTALWTVYHAFFKYGDTCGVFDWHGDILSAGSLAHGLYR